MVQNVISIRGVRIAELLLAFYIIGFGVLLAIFRDFRNMLPNIDLLLTSVFWSVFFLAPLALGITVLVGTYMNGMSIRSFIIGGIAVATLLVVSFSTYLYVYPPEGSGLIVGHLVSYGSGLVFSFVVLLRHTISRVVPSEVWSQENFG